MEKTENVTIVDSRNNEVYNPNGMYRIRRCVTRRQTRFRVCTVELAKATWSQVETDLAQPCVGRVWLQVISLTGLAMRYKGKSWRLCWCLLWQVARPDSDLTLDISLYFFWSYTKVLRSRVRTPAYPSAILEILGRTPTAWPQGSRIAFLRLQSKNTHRNQLRVSLFDSIEQMSDLTTVLGQVQFWAAKCSFEQQSAVLSSEVQFWAAKLFLSAKCVRLVLKFSWSKTCLYRRRNVMTSPRWHASLP